MFVQNTLTHKLQPAAPVKTLNNGIPVSTQGSFSPFEK